MLPGSLLPPFLRREPGDEANGYPACIYSNLCLSLQRLPIMRPPFIPMVPVRGPMPPGPHPMDHAPHPPHPHPMDPSSLSGMPPPHMMAATGGMGPSTSQVCVCGCGCGCVGGGCDCRHFLRPFRELLPCPRLPPSPLKASLSIPLSPPQPLSLEISTSCRPHWAGDPSPALTGLWRNSHQITLTTSGMCSTCTN